MGERKQLWINALKIIWILYVAGSIIFLVFKVDQLLSRDYDEVSKHVSLNDNWEIEMNSTIYQNVSLDDFQVDKVQKGDRITMQTMLPKDWDITQGALRLHIRQSAVKMYIDDELMYEYGQDRVAQNKTVGSGFQFIKFPEQYKGKTLKIELYVAEDDAFIKFDSIRIYEWENAYRALVTENRIPMFFGSFLVIFGLSILVITMFAILMSRKYAKIFCISLFSICVGLWTLCYYNVVLVYSIPLYTVSLMEYMVLYLTPLPILIYMHDNVKKFKNKVFRALYWVLLIVQLAFDVVFITLHTMDILHCAAVLKYFQILIVCELLYFTFVLLWNLKSSKRIDRLYLIGMLVVAGCVGHDLASYYCNRYQRNSFLSIKGISAIGVMILIFILIYTFYLNITEKMMKEAERNSLIKSAYTDELTQLSNRRYCSEYMTKIDNEADSDYAVICFDLNNLKIINDTYGHAKGDILIKSGAEVISETFGTHGVVGRMGGDEFIAILITDSKEDMDEWIEEFIANLKRKNQEEPELNLSISYGYALSYEVEEKNVEKIYQIADDRMYEYKKQYKKQYKNSNHL